MNFWLIIKLICVLLGWGQPIMDEKGINPDGGKYWVWSMQVAPPVHDGWDGKGWIVVTRQDANYNEYKNITISLNY